MTAQSKSGHNKCNRKCAEQSEQHVMAPTGDDCQHDESPVKPVRRNSVHRSDLAALIMSAYGYSSILSAAAWIGKTIHNSWI
jgi:hypothetical protein